MYFTDNDSRSTEMHPVATNPNSFGVGHGANDGDEGPERGAEPLSRAEGGV